MSKKKEAVKGTKEQEQEDTHPMLAGYDPNAVLCDQCMGVISGVCFTCDVCEQPHSSYDLCATCHAGDGHDKSHTFTRTELDQ